MKISQAEMEARLAEVRRSYIASLREKREAIETHWSVLSDNWDDGRYRALFLILHSLSGSAETFGLGDITRDARKLVTRFKQLDDTGATTASALDGMQADFECLLASMQSALEELD